MTGLKLNVKIVYLTIFIEFLCLKNELLNLPLTLVITFTSIYSGHFVTVFPIQHPYWAYGLVCMLLYKSLTSHSSQVDAIAALQSFHTRKSQCLTDFAHHI